MGCSARFFWGESSGLILIFIGQKCGFDDKIPFFDIKKM